MPPPPQAIVQASVPSAGSAAKFGKLVVKVVKGIDLKAGQGMFGKADPYVRLKIGGQEQATKPHAQGGKNPVWNQEFDFEISTEKELEIDVMDKEQVGNDKFMGRAKVGIMDWIALGHFEGEINVLDKAEKEVGKINVNVKFERPGANAMAAAKPMGGGGSTRRRTRARGSPRPRRGSSRPGTRPGSSPTRRSGRRSRPSTSTRTTSSEPRRSGTCSSTSGSRSRTRRSTR